MNTVPAIGCARGLFEIFVPGVFLLLNLGVALCLLPLDRSFLSRTPPIGFLRLSVLDDLGQKKFFKGNELFGIKGDYHGKPP